MLNIFHRFAVAASSITLFIGSFFGHPITKNTSIQSHVATSTPVTVAVPAISTSVKKTSAIQTTSTLVNPNYHPIAPTQSDLDAIAAFQVQSKVQAQQDSLVVQQQVEVQAQDEIQTVTDIATTSSDYDVKNQARIAAINTINKQISDTDAAYNKKFDDVLHETDLTGDQKIPALWTVNRDHATAIDALKAQLLQYIQTN